MAEKSISEELRILSAKLNKGSEGGALSNENIAWSKWLEKNTGFKLVNGKKVRVWKPGNTANQPSGQEVKLDTHRIGLGIPLLSPRQNVQSISKDVKSQFFKEYYGTATPRKDLQYLQESAKSKLRIGTLRGDSIRTNLSQKDYLGNNIYQQEIDAKEKAENERLFNLSLGTSYDQALNPKSPGYKGGGEEVGTMVNGVLQTPSTSTGAPITKDNQSQSPGEIKKQGELVTNQDLTEIKGVTQPITQPVRGSLKRWTRGSGESLDAADARTEAWLKQQGYDHTKISKHDKREVYRELRARGPWVVGDTLKLGDPFSHRSKQYNLTKLKINPPKPVETVAP